MSDCWRNQGLDRDINFIVRWLHLSLIKFFIAAFFRTPQGNPAKHLKGK